MLYWSNWDFSHTGNSGHFNFTLEESQLWQSCVSQPQLIPNVGGISTRIFARATSSLPAAAGCSSCAHLRLTGHWVFRLIHWTWHWPSPWHYAHTCDSQDIGCSVSSTVPDTDHHPDTMIRGEKVTASQAGIQTNSLSIASASSSSPKAAKCRLSKEHSKMYYKNRTLPTALSHEIQHCVSESSVYSLTKSRYWQW